MGQKPELANYLILLVEDEYLQASDMAQSIERAGGRVLGPCPTQAEALARIEAQMPAAAVLDLHLGDGSSVELATLLRDQGVPLLVVTGYHRALLPDELADVPWIEKPAPTGQIVSCLAALLKGEPLVGYLASAPQPRASRSSPRDEATDR